MKKASWSKKLLQVGFYKIALATWYLDFTIRSVTNDAFEIC